LLGGEQVHDGVSVVQDDPAALGDALAPLRTDVLLGQFLLDVLGDRAELPRVLDRADDEVVGDGREMSDIEDENVSCQRVRCDLRDLPRKRCRLDNALLSGQRVRTPL
jgi:hypothetical protein